MKRNLSHGSCCPNLQPAKPRDKRAGGTSTLGARGCTSNTPLALARILYYRVTAAYPVEAYLYGQIRLTIHMDCLLKPFNCILQPASWGRPSDALCSRGWTNRPLCPGRIFYYRSRVEHFIFIPGEEKLSIAIFPVLLQAINPTHTRLVMHYKFSFSHLNFSGQHLQETSLDMDNDQVLVLWTREYCLWNSNMFW